MKLHFGLAALLAAVFFLSQKLKAKLTITEYSSFIRGSKK